MGGGGWGWGEHFLRLLGCKKMTWSYFLVFQKNAILKNAVSERWCTDSSYFRKTKSLLKMGPVYL